jgi:short-subunit dehydrogenase
MSRRVAVVTGASSGIGSALARRLAARGLAVGLTARRECALNQLVEEIQSLGGIASMAPADAADPLQTRAALERLREALGPIDLLIANAGIAERNPVETFSAEVLERMFRVNVLGVTYAIEAVLPRMLQRGSGQIVGVSSLAGYRACSPGHFGYSASKAALTTLLDGLRVELRPRGVAVTIVHPGYVHTPMTAGNTRWMPFVMNLDRAADLIVRGILARRPRIDFPWQAALGMTLVRWLPISVYDRVFSTLYRGHPSSRSRD